MQSLMSSLDVERLVTRVVEFVPDLVAAILVLVAFVLLARWTRRPLAAALRRGNMEPKLVELLADRIYRSTIIVIGLVMALSQLGIDVTAAVASIGVVGIAIGFAAQDSLASVISGILIFWDKPFQVGDWVEVEGQFGQVSDITLRTTRIRTSRNAYVVIPNKEIIDSVLVNTSKHGRLRVDVPVGIAYKEDIDAARDVMLRAGSEVEGVLSEPSPQVVVTGLGASSVDLALRVWIDDAGDQRAVFFRVVEAAKKALDEADIEIPFPHLQLFLDNVQPPVWDQAAKLAEPWRPGAGSTG